MGMKDKEQNLNNQNFPQRRETLDSFYESDPVKTGLENYDVQSMTEHVAKEEIAVGGELGPEELVEFRIIEAAEKIIFTARKNRQKFVDNMNA